MWKPTEAEPQTEGQAPSPIGPGADPQPEAPAPPDRLLLAAQRAVPALSLVAASFLAGYDPIMMAACSGGCGHGL